MALIYFFDVVIFDPQCYQYILKIGKGWKDHDSHECLLNVSNRF